MRFLLAPEGVGIQLQVYKIRSALFIYSSCVSPRSVSSRSSKSTAKGFIYHCVTLIHFSCWRVILLRWNIFRVHVVSLCCDHLNQIPKNNKSLFIAGVVTSETINRQQVANAPTVSMWACSDWKRKFLCQTSRHHTSKTSGWSSCLQIQQPGLYHSLYL